MSYLAFVLNVFFSKEELGRFRNILSVNGYCRGIESFIIESIFLGFFLSSFFLFFGFEIGMENLYIIFASFLSLISPLIIRYVWHFSRFDLKRRRIEGSVVDLLLQASVFPAGTDIHAVIKYVANADLGYLSKEFSAVLREIRQGGNIEQALNSMDRRVDSPVLRKAVRLMLQGYETGCDMNTVFRETAEDIMETNSLIQERSAQFTISKYTLLLSGAIIIPLVLGLIVRLVSGMDFSFVSDLELGLPIEERNILFETALKGNMFYLFEYGLLSSVFIANQENNIRKATVYALFIVPVSYAVYFLVQFF